MSAFFSRTQLGATEIERERYNNGRQCKSFYRADNSFLRTKVYGVDGQRFLASNQANLTNQSQDLFHAPIHSYNTWKGVKKENTRTQVNVFCTREGCTLTVQVDSFWPFN